MEDLGRYRDWLVRARGVTAPSEEQVRRFAAEVQAHRPRASILELVLFWWLDRKCGYPGTKRYLSSQGFVDPSAEDLAHFHRRIAGALLLRGSVALVLVVGLWAYLWWAHLLP